MSDRENVIKNLVICTSGYCEGCTYHKPGGMHLGCWNILMKDVARLLKEQEAEIRQLRLALDIVKGTCKGIKSGGGQFADMPTMQSAT